MQISAAKADSSRTGATYVHLDYALLGAFALLWLAIVPTPGAELVADRASGVDCGVAGRWAGARRQPARHRLLCAGHAARAGLAAGRRALGAARRLRAGRGLSGVGRARASLAVGWRGGGPATRCARRTAGEGVRAARSCRACSPRLPTCRRCSFSPASSPASASSPPTRRRKPRHRHHRRRQRRLPCPARLAHAARAPRAFYARNRGLMEIGFGLLFLAFGARLLAREAVGWL